MKNLVPTPETCEALKAAGFPQETALEHIKYPGREMQVRPSGEHQVMSIHYEYLCAAPTLQEILEELPNFTRCWQDNSVGLWYTWVPTMDTEPIAHPNPAEAAAQLWLKLQEATVTLTAEELSDARRSYDLRMGRPKRIKR